MRGVPLHTDTRKLIYRLWREGKDRNDIHTTIFADDETKLSMKGLQNILTKFKDAVSLDRYMEGPHVSHDGRPRKMDAFATTYFINFLNRENGRRRYLPAHACALEFITEFYLPGDASTPSARTVMRAYKRIKWSRKKITRRNIRANANEQLAFLQRASFLREDDIVDIDETPGGREQFLQRYGYAPIGEACVKTQIKIGTVSYSIV